MHELFEADLQPRLASLGYAGIMQQRQGSSKNSVAAAAAALLRLLLS